jgi:hypothetical protein
MRLDQPLVQLLPGVLLVLHMSMLQLSSQHLDRPSNKHPEHLSLALAKRAGTQLVRAVPAGSAPEKRAMPPCTMLTRQWLPILAVYGIVCVESLARPPAT